MPPTPKSIREDLARAKAAFAKNDDLRCVQLVAMAMRATLTVKLPSQDRTMIDGLLRENFANLGKLPRVLHYAPNGIPFAKGQEKKLTAYLIQLAKKIEADIRREDLEAMRERKLRIDKSVIQGTKLLSEGNLLEAQRNFRAAVEDYVDEKGLFPLIATRLIEAGHYKASFEYTKRAIEESPDNPRAYDFVVTAATKGDEWKTSQKILHDLQSKVGVNPQFLQCLAMVEARLGNWSEARQAARKALETDPRLDDAKRVQAQADKKLAQPAASSAS